MGSGLTQRRSSFVVAPFVVRSFVVRSFVVASFVIASFGWQPRAAAAQPDLPARAFKPLRVRSRFSSLDLITARKESIARCWRADSVDAYRY